MNKLILALAVLSVSLGAAVTETPKDCSKEQCCKADKACPKKDCKPGDKACAKDGKDCPKDGKQCTEHKKDPKKA